DYGIASSSLMRYSPYSYYVERLFQVNAKRDINRAKRVNIVLQETYWVGTTASASLDTSTFPYPTVTVSFAPDSTSTDIVSAINSGDAGDYLTATEFVNATGIISIPSTLTTEADFLLSSLEVGEDWNEYSILFEDTASAGNEVVTLVGKIIQVELELGVSTALQVATAINTDPEVSTLVLATAGNNTDRFDPGTTLAINLANGLDVTPNKRNDIGFRCVAPIRDALYSADQEHTYIYKQCEVDTGPNLESKVICK
ncbi:MAG: hypothetical protein KAG61_12585, partial [Bacteriovoracaceae bacterium]|nr:hypothetical protein [Bacteriovoracaceae bacterium]